MAKKGKKSKTSKLKGPVAVPAAKNQRVFSCQMKVEPHKNSLDLKWPDGKLAFVLVHDELLRLSGFKEFWAEHFGTYRVTLSLKFHEAVSPDFALKVAPVLAVAPDPIEDMGELSEEE
ncbi:MAG: hypothetical protein WCJ35_19190 [Planctomycetota bacterium]